MLLQEIKLAAKNRAVPTKELNTQRKRGLVPAELYGSGKTNQHLFLSKLEAERVYQQAGSSSLVDLAVENHGAVKVMIKDAQFDPVTGNLNHLDLQEIEMNKEMFVNVPLQFVGEAKAVKEHGATLVTPLQDVEISCLPKDLVPHLEVDLSALANLGDVIRVKDLQIPSTIKIMTGLNEVVASAILQKIEAEPVAAPAPAEGELAVGAETLAQTGAEDAATAAEAGSGGKAGGEAGKKKPEDKK